MSLSARDFDRTEIIRLILQSLESLDLKESFNTLTRESNVDLEIEEIRSLKSAIINGQWNLSIQLLEQLNLDDNNLKSSMELIYVQQYKELLSSGNDQKAIQVLRNYLTPLLHDQNDKIKQLSCLLMSPFLINNLKQSRSIVLKDLENFIQSDLLLPNNRLFTLLNQSIQYQSDNFFYVSNTNEVSLLNDLKNDSLSFPNYNNSLIKAHKDEIWHCSFTKDETYFATASKDKSIIIWSIDYTNNSIKKIKHLKDFDQDVSVIKFSNDQSTFIIAIENVLIFYETVNYTVKFKSDDQHDETISNLLFTFDDSILYSTALDQKLLEWDLNGNLLYKWDQLPIRITDSLLTPNNKSIILIGPDGPQPTLSSDGTLSYTEEMRRLMIYDLTTRDCIWQIEMKNEISSLNSSQLLFNYAPNELQLWDLNNRCLIKKLYGHRQSQHVIKSSFGGYNENFIISGSEDSNIYVWHRKSGKLIQILKGHQIGCVNSITWLSNKPLICSVGDDSFIRFWSTKDSNQVQLNFINDDNDSVHYQDGSNSDNEENINMTDD
ncbi:WD40 repeat-like protein [Wallemia mellicola]|nr:WD40 repeat-like protein [Wallemia mellicola]